MSQYLTTLGQAEEFFKRCVERKAESREARLEILAEMAKERRMFAIDEKQLAKRLEGKKVLHIKNKKELRLVKNSAMCLKCKDIITSYTRYDFVTCRCHALSVDGGLDYVRRLGNQADFKNLCVYE